jgi:hypothetical protein
MAEPAEAAKARATAVKTAEPDPQTSPVGPVAAAGTEHRFEEARRNAIGAANLEEDTQVQVTRPDVVLPSARETTATAVPPRAAEIAPEARPFENVEIDALLTRGDAFFATGDLASARRFYETAAAAGNGVAALRLGGTFDPAFLARVHVGRIRGDLLSALYWYRRARDLGDGDAEILLRGRENTAR